MKEAEILNNQVKKYLLDVFLNSNFEEWQDGSNTLTFKDEKKKTSILVIDNNNGLFVEIYLHIDGKQTKETNNGHVWGSYIFKYERRIKKIHEFHFFCTTRKVKRKVDSINEYFKDRTEYARAKNAFDALPIGYQRKTKLEQIENGD